MEISSKDLAKQRYRSGGRGRGGSRGGHQAGGGSHATARGADLESNEFRFADDDDEDGDDTATAAGAAAVKATTSKGGKPIAAPVRKSRGVDFEQLIAEAELTHTQSYYRHTAYLQEDLAADVPGLASDDPDQDLLLDLHALAASIAALPLHVLLGLDPMYLGELQPSPPHTPTLLQQHQQKQHEAQQAAQRQQQSLQQQWHLPPSAVQASVATDYTAWQEEDDDAQQLPPACADSDDQPSFSFSSVSAASAAAAAVASPSRQQLEQHNQQHGSVPSDASTPSEALWLNPTSLPRTGLAITIPLNSSISEEILLANNTAATPSSATSLSSARMSHSNSQLDPLLPAFPELTSFLEDADAPDELDGLMSRCGVQSLSMTQGVDFKLSRPPAGRTVSASATCTVRGPPAFNCITEPAMAAAHTASASNGMHDPVDARAGGSTACVGAIDQEANRPIWTNSLPITTTSSKSAPVGGLLAGLPLVTAPRSSTSPGGQSPVLSPTATAGTTPPSGSSLLPGSRERRSSCGSGSGSGGTRQPVRSPGSGKPPLSPTSQALMRAAQQAGQLGFKAHSPVFGTALFGSRHSPPLPLAPSVRPHGVDLLAATSIGSGSSASSVSSSRISSISSNNIKRGFNLAPSTSVKNAVTAGVQGATAVAGTTSSAPAVSSDVPAPLLTQHSRDAELDELLGLAPPKQKQKSSLAIPPVSQFVSSSKPAAANTLAPVHMVKRPAAVTKATLAPKAASTASLDDWLDSL